MRKASAFGDAISAVVYSVERAFKVETSTRATTLVDESIVAEWRKELHQAAQEVAEDGLPRTIEVDGLSSSISATRRPARTTYHGPLVAEDAWARFAVRLVEKAEQTSEGPRTWIRIDEVGGLILLTPVVYLEPHEQLFALKHNLETTLIDYPHVVGVLISLGAGPNWTGNAPQFTYFADPAEGWESATVIERVLPGAKRRRSFAIPLRSNRLILPPGAGLPISRWYADETNWLEWALEQLGKPPLAQIVRFRTGLE